MRSGASTPIQAQAIGQRHADRGGETQPRLGARGMRLVEHPVIGSTLASRPVAVEEGRQAEQVGGHGCGSSARTHFSTVAGSCATSRSRFALLGRGQRQGVAGVQPRQASPSFRRAAEKRTHPRMGVLDFIHRVAVAALARQIEVEG
jgi:hypothetical protein